MLQMARRRDPFPPGYYWEGLAIAQMIAGEAKDALSSLANMPRLFWWDVCYKAACHWQLRQTQDAQQAVAEVLRQMPGLTVGAAMTAEPFSRQEDSKRLAEALCAAGLPDW